MTKQASHSEHLHLLIYFRIFYVVFWARMLCDFTWYHTPQDLDWHLELIFKTSEFYELHCPVHVSVQILQHCCSVTFLQDVFCIDTLLVYFACHTNSLHTTAWYVFEVDSAPHEARVSRNCVFYLDYGHIWGISGLIFQTPEQSCRSSTLCVHLINCDQIFVTYCNTEEPKYTLNEHSQCQHILKRHYQI